ncbi:hypothetical protein [Methanospirillum hungatei]|nr:hypothetical protein [Methanospirillum hungatei]
MHNPVLRMTDPDIRLKMCVVLVKKKTEIRFVFHERSFQFPAFFGTYHDKARGTTY